MKHTKEPWDTAREEFGADLSGKELDYAMWRRFVATQRACASVHTETLELVSVSKLLEAAEAAANDAWYVEDGESGDHFIIDAGLVQALKAALPDPPSD